MGERIDGICLCFQCLRFDNCIPRTNVLGGGGGGGYYGLVVVTPHPQRFHRSPDNLKNPYWIASIFYM